MWYFVTKIVLIYCEKKNVPVIRKIWKFEAEGQDFAKFLRSLERSEKNLVTECFCNFFLELINWNNYISNWKKNCDLETFRKD